MASGCPSRESNSGTTNVPISPVDYEDDEGYGGDSVQRGGSNQATATSSAQPLGLAPPTNPGYLPGTARQQPPVSRQLPSINVVPPSPRPRSAPLPRTTSPFPPPPPPPPSFAESSIQSGDLLHQTQSMYRQSSAGSLSRMPTLTAAIPPLQVAKLLNNSMPPAPASMRPLTFKPRSPSPLSTVTHSTPSTLSSSLTGTIGANKAARTEERRLNELFAQPAKSQAGVQRNETAALISGAGAWADAALEGHFPGPVTLNSQVGLEPATGPTNRPIAKAHGTKGAGVRRGGGDGSATDQEMTGVGGSSGAMTRTAGPRGAQAAQRSSRRESESLRDDSPPEEGRATKRVKPVSSLQSTIRPRDGPGAPEGPTRNAAAINSGNTTSQPQQSGGLFGASTAASQPQQSGGLFGASATASSQPQQQAGGLFGNTGANPQTSKPGGQFTLGAPPATLAAQQQPAGGLFGATPAVSKPSGLFGGAAAPASSAPAAGGLFGASTAASSAAPAGGLFGAAPAASAQPASGGLFGASTAAPAASKPGGLFGAAPASQPAAGGLFGPTATAQQPASGGLFGAKPATGGLFGQPAASQPAQPQPAPSSSLFGALNNASASTQPQQQSVQAVKIDWSNVKPTTRFNELHQEVQDAIVQVDELIQGAMRTSMQCSEAMPRLGTQIGGVPADVEYLDRRLETVEGALARDAVAVGQNKEVIEADSEDAVRLFRAIENLKLPSQFHYPTIGGAPASDETSTTTDLMSYFVKRAQELEAQAKLFERHQREVDAHLRTVEQGVGEGLRKVGRKGEREVGEGLREVAGVMRTFEEAILRVAERVGEGREKVVDLEVGGG